MVGLPAGIHGSAKCARPCYCALASGSAALDLRTISQIQPQSARIKETKPLKLEPLFQLGQTVSTPGALEALSDSSQTPLEFFSRHGAGDWGEIDGDDRKANEQALEDGSRLLSAYTLRDGTRIYVTTEADRSATTILLAEEY